VEKIALEKLHERRGVRIDVVGARCVEIRIAGTGDVNHRRHVEVDQLFEKRIPVTIRQWRPTPHAPGRVRIEVAAHETEFGHAALEFRECVLDRHTDRLGKLTDADEIVREEPDHTVNEIIVDARPGNRHGLVADMVRHGRGFGREDRHVGAALL
jgi:hypothetical protein